MDILMNGSLGRETVPSAGFVTSRRASARENNSFSRLKSEASLVPYRSGVGVEQPSREGRP